MILKIPIISEEILFQVIRFFKELDILNEFHKKFYIALIVNPPSMEFAFHYQQVDHIQHEIIYCNYLQSR